VAAPEKGTGVTTDLHDETWEPSWTLRFDLRVPPDQDDRRSAHFRDALELIGTSDTAGCTAIVVSEHHGAEDGYLPSALTFAAAVAARTSRARIAISALILPLHEPIHAAEETLVVDQLSGGRVDVIVGLGYVRDEFWMFGHDPTGRVALLEEKLPVYMAALTGEPFTFQGRTVQVTPGPVQRPRPVVLLAASVPAAARRAARLADGLHCLVPRALVEPAYLEERSALGRDNGFVAGGDGSATNVFVTDDPERSWAELAPYLLHETNAYGRWAMANDANRHLYQPTDDLGAVKASGMYAVETPADAARRLVDAGPAGVFLNPLVGGVPRAVAEPYLAAFIDDALPQARALHKERQGAARV